MNLMIIGLFVLVILITSLFVFTNVYIKELFFKKKRVIFSLIFIVSGFLFGLAIGGFINISIVICNLIEYLINKKRVK
jgi:MFS family permease